MFSNQDRRRTAVYLCSIIRFTSVNDLPTAFGFVVFVTVDKSTIIRNIELNIYVIIYIVNINMMFEMKFV